VADLLLELFSEEIPARMQKGASDAQKSLLEGLFKASDMPFKGVEAYSTPRRITAHVTGLPAKTADIAEERRGPKVGAPDQAVAGFSKSAGVDPKDLVEKDGVMYLTTSVPVNVFCAVKDRHDNITLDPGTYTIQPAKEYDYLTDEIRKVKD